MAFGFVRRHPAWSWTLAVLVLLTVLTLIFLPRFIHLGLERWLERQGRISVQIEDVDFNPFTGKLTVQTLIAEREEAQGRLAWELARLNIAWWPLVEQHIKMEALSLRDAVITIRREPGAFYIGGLRIRTGGDSEAKKDGEEGWQFGFEDIDLQNVRIRYLDKEFEKEFLIPQAHIGGMQAWNPQNAGALDALIEAGGGTLSLSGTALPFAERPEIDTRLEVEGFAVEWLQPWLEQTPVSVRRAILFTDLQLELKQFPDTGSLDLRINGTARLEEVEAQVAEVALEETDLAWEGALSLTLPEEEEPRLTVDGILSSAALKLQVSEPPVGVRARDAQVQLLYTRGTPEVPAGDGFALTLSGSTGRVALSDTSMDLVFAAWQALELEEAHLEGSRSYSIGRLVAEELRLLERKEEKPFPYYLQASLLEAAGLKAGAAEPLFQADLVRAQNLEGLLMRTEEGIDLSPWPLPTGKDAEEEKTDTRPIPGLRLGRVDIGQGSRLLILDFSLQPELRLDLAPLRIHAENIDTITENPQQPARFEIALEANGNPLSLEGTARAADGRLGAEVDLKATRWPVSLLQPYVGGKATLENGLLTLDTKLSGAYHLQENRLNVEGEGLVQVADLHGTLGGMRLQRASMRWNGQAALAAELAGERGGEPPKPAITAAGEIRSSLLDLILPEAGLRIEAKTVRLQGDFAMGTDAVPRNASFLLTAEGEAASLRAEDRKKDLNLATLRGIELAEGRMESPEVLSAGSIKAAEVRLLERPGETEAGGSHFLEAAPVHLKGLRTSGAADLTLSEFRAVNLEGILVREANGDFPFGKWLPAKQEKEQKKEGPLQLRVDLLELGGDASRLRYLDRSVEPFVDLELRPFRIRIEGLTTAEPRKSPVEVEGRFAKYSHLRLDGHLLSLVEKPTMDFILQVEGFSLPKLTGYTEKLFGYAARSGNLDLMANIRVENGELDAETDWVLTKLNLDAVDPEKREQTKGLLGFSLQTGVSLLRDGDGVIKLEIPVTGEVTSPQFQFSDVIQKAVLKGIRSAALAYFSPLGLVAKLGKELLIDKVMEMRFKPALFAAGKTRLSPETRGYLDEVAKRLRERPNVAVVVCGIVAPPDLKSLGVEDPSGEQMLALARARGEKVRDYLVEQGIASDRLIQCAPEVDRSEDASPRAEIGI